MNEVGIQKQILGSSKTRGSMAMEKCYRVDRYPSWVEEKMSSSKPLGRKKKSLWSWAPIRAIAKIGQQQFYCVFSIFVQMIDGLPSSLESLRLVVQLERKSKLWQTMPSRVFQCIAEFDETLHIETTIFGRESNVQDHTLKFMPKDYILSVVAIDAPEHFLFNQHRIDLSRLLPASVEGFWEPDKPMSSTASFKLGGKAEGAILVATFDFEVLNEEFRQPSLAIDGNASARFKGSSLRQVPKAVKSLPSSPNPSPFVRRPNFHFTSPCTSDVESTDSTCIEKVELDSSAKETGEWSVHDYSSSDEERFQALRNDPLSLDAVGELEPVALSPAIKLQEQSGSLDGFSTQSHFANSDCFEKVKVFLFSRTKSDSAALCHHIDFQRLLNCEEPEEKAGGVAFQRNQENSQVPAQFGVQILERHQLASDCVKKIETPSTRRTKSETFYDQTDVPRQLICQEPQKVNIILQSKQESEKFSPHIGVGASERNSHAGELAADKFCIDVKTVESCPTANIFKGGFNDMISSNERVEEQCFMGGSRLSPAFVRSKSSDSYHEALTLNEVEVCSEVNEKHMLFEGVQASYPETLKGPLKGAEAPSPETFRLTTAYPQNESEVCVETLADSKLEVAAHQCWKDVGLQSGSEEDLQISAVAGDGVASKPFKSDENVELDIFQFSAEDEELSFEASIVAEDFLNLLEREECTGPNSPAAVVPEESSRRELSPEDYRLSCLGEHYIINNPFQYIQQEVDLCVRTPVNADLLATTNGPQVTKEGGETFDCAKYSQDYVMEDELGLLSIMEAAESEMKKAAQRQRSKERAKMLEDSETKALMQKWGLTDRAFESTSFNMSPYVAWHGLQTSNSTPMVRLKDGGSLKVMNLDGFQPGSNLVMQVSRPVVIPARTSSCLDILRSIASQGLENMTMQAFTRMPMEDLIGLSMEQFVASDVIAEDGGPGGSSSTSPPRLGSSSGQKSSVANCIDCTLVKPLDLQLLSEEVISFCDLTHIALKRIEPLAIEGLKVQCNLSKAAPESVYIKSLDIQNNKIYEEIRHNSPHFHDGQPSSAKSLLDMTISLDDWLQLCEGVTNIKSEIPVSQFYLETQRKDEHSRVDNISDGQTRASVSNNLTMAMLLQLRDPQRYYEPVGASMMALVQAERVNQPRASSTTSKNESDTATNIHFKQGIDQLYGIKSGVKLKITGVHVSGVQLSEENSNKSWGNKAQLQSGSRWLVANTRTNKSRHVASCSSTHVEAKAKSGKGETLWSLSACVHATGSSWRAPKDVCAHIRNPDLTFATDDAMSIL